MNKIDFSKVGGFPLTTDALGNMQDAYRFGIDALTKLGGDNYILSGCVENNNVVGDGVLVINGEAIPFKGGVKQTTIYIKETVTQGQFEDGNLKDIYFSREARFGSGGYPWVDFVRITNLLELKNALDAQTKAFNDYTTTYKPSWDIITNKPTAYPPSTHKTAWADITDRPPIAPVIAMGRTPYYDPGDSSCPGRVDDNSNLITVHFSPSDTKYGSNYRVCCTMVGDGRAGNDSLFWLTEGYLPGSFQVRLRENSPWTQRVAFDYIIIANVVL